MMFRGSEKYPAHERLLSSSGIENLLQFAWRPFTKSIKGENSFKCFLWVVDVKTNGIKSLLGKIELMLTSLDLQSFYQITASNFTQVPLSSFSLFG
jgi:hypothetical protein